MICKVCGKQSKVAVSMLSPVEGYNLKLIAACSKPCIDTLWTHYTKSHEQGKQEAFKSHYKVTDVNVVNGVSKEWMMIEWDVR